MSSNSSVTACAAKVHGSSSKPTKDQLRELSRLIDAGPPECGFSGACWRSPMVQQLIKERFAVSYSVFYIAELLKNLGFRPCRMFAPPFALPSSSSAARKPCASVVAAPRP